MVKPASKTVLVILGKSGLTRNILELVLYDAGVELHYAAPEELSQALLKAYPWAIVDDHAAPDAAGLRDLLGPAGLNLRVIYLASDATPDLGSENWTVLAKPFPPAELQELLSDTRKPI